METESFVELSIKTTIDVSDTLSDFLISLDSQGVVIDKGENEVVSHDIILKAYFSSILNIDDIKKEVLAYLKKLSDLNLDIGLGDVSISSFENKDWENDFKQYFETFKVGRHLVIKPIWQEYEKNIDELVIDFDPGSFFGSTPHPSTRLCLEEIEELSLMIEKKDDLNILDLGVGSGILSLVLFKLGFKNITAIDIDPVAIRNSEDNFELNNMDINLFLGEIKDCKENYDIIAGNLLAETIIELSSQISSKLNEKGFFIGAGVTKSQENLVIEEMEKNSLFLDKKKYFDEWVLLRFIKKSF